jgi:predicted aspartyl protease
MNIIKTETDARTSGTDVSNLGDNITMTVKTADGKEIDLHLYGR